MEEDTRNKWKLGRTIILIFISLTVLVLGSLLKYESVFADGQIYTVTYSGNEATGGAIPTEPIQYVTNDTVIVLSNTGGLVKNGYIFGG